jgi:hypothetical protein
MAGSIAYMDISGQLLRDLLHLPADAEIIASSEGTDNIVRVLVAHDSIPRSAIRVTGMYRSIHGVSVFDRFDVAESVPRHDPATSRGGGTEKV